ncbi:MAG TPA: glycoside hydrolase family 3 N-terminal domain-containing protein [Rhodothermales bacterium]|nr:glycoside hydrolase family 3 N-terminal domain-containing protein [Rhodothermales bacterium]
MRRLLFVGLIALGDAAVPARVSAQEVEDRDPRIDALLAEMTIQEKVGQMTQLALDAVSSRAESDSTSHALDLRKLREAVVRRNVGSIINVYLAAFTRERWAEVIKSIQDLAVSGSRLKIPVLYGIDAVHGHNYMRGATLFPQNIAMAATWNRELVHRANEITAIEMRASGIPWNFSPVLDIGRQPLWSRFFETFGEDVFLVSEMGLAAVDGLQGTDVGQPHRVAACGKHFLGYSLPLSGKDRTPAWIPDRILREYVLPPFARAVDAGLQTIMVNSSEINGEPVHASRAILTDLLRDEMGFKGVVVSDWEDINRLHTVHRVAETQRDAVRLAIEAGIDMSMVPYDYSFTDHLIALVRDGVIPESRLDESVRRILKLKIDLGLFENPYAQESPAGLVGTEDFADVSRTAAEEAITLLRNEDAVLPLSPAAKVLVTGPGAASLPALHGSWTYTWQGTNEAVYPDTPTILDAIVDRRGLQLTSFVPGTSWEEEVNIAAAVEQAFRSDVVVIALGESPSTEKPGDIDELDLPEIQRRLVGAISSTGKPIVLILTQNRPRIVREIVPLSDAVILAYQPGPYGPDAIAGVLTGEVNPSGRLPFTYPSYSGSIVPYDHKNAERDDRNFGRNGFNPQWEFGEGLSYTTFAYDKLRLASDTLTIDDALELTLEVANRGSLPGKEVVQVYVRDEYASITPSTRRLKAFEKVYIESAASTEISFSISVSELGFVNADDRYVVEPGAFTVMVGGLEAEFIVR